MNGIRNAIEIGVACPTESVALACDASSAVNLIQKSDDRARSARRLHGVATEFTTHVVEIDRGRD